MDEERDEELDEKEPGADDLEESLDGEVGDLDDTELDPDTEEEEEEEEAY